ncbi:MAG: hypothetical protein HY763_09070 [Planctomycetes bacterium]|nr:hypothetical protein [Planctomycetota bacterium]
MSKLKKALVEAVVLGVAGIALGLVSNAVRDRGSLSLTKDYFSKGTAPRSPDPGLAAATGERRDAVAKSTPAPAAPGTNGDPPRAAPPKKHPKHNYQEIQFDDVADVLKAPEHQQGLWVLVDARKDDLYEAGHLPGAIQADHYDIDRYRDHLLEHVQPAEKIIVYCGGGDCEDSIFLCGDLMEMGIEYDRVFLYPGGFSEWEAKNMPVETGKGN